EALTRTLARAKTAAAFMRSRSLAVALAPAASRFISIAALFVGQAPAHVMDEDGLERRLHFGQVEDRAFQTLEPAEHFPDHIILDDRDLELDRSGRGVG